MAAEKSQNIYSKNGLMSSSVIANIMDDIEMLCDHNFFSEVLKKKILNIAIEMLQNSYHYTKEFKDQKLKSYQFQIDTDREFVYLSSQNHIQTKDIESVKQRILSVNSLSDEELKLAYKKILNNEKFSKRGGAGLGFLDMKRRSSNSLKAEFSNVQSNSQFYTLTVKIKANG